MKAEAHFWGKTGINSHALSGGFCFDNWQLFDLFVKQTEHCDWRRARGTLPFRFVNHCI